MKAKKIDKRYFDGTDVVIKPQYREVVSARVDPLVVAKVRQYARTNGVSASNQVEYMLRVAIDVIEKAISEQAGVAGYKKEVQK